MMSERAAFQSCLSEFMVLVEEMERVEVVAVDEVVDKVDEVVDKASVDRDEDEDEDDEEQLSSSEEYKSARASFGSYLEDKGRLVMFPATFPIRKFQSQDLVP